MPIKIEYLGWSVFRLTTAQGTKIVTDPFLAGDDTRKIPPAVVAVRDLVDTDIVTVTHAAKDHDAQTVELMKASKATLFCPRDVYAKAIKANIPSERAYYMVPGVRFKFMDIHIKAFEASHISLSEFNGHWITGVPLSYIFDFGGDGKVFFSGDNALGLHYRFIGEMYHPDLAILGIGGVMQKDQYLTELYPDEAAVAARWLNVQGVIPMHYLGNESEELAKEIVKQAPAVKLTVMKPGQAVHFSRSEGIK